MRECKTCKFWDTPEGYSNRRLCLAAIEGWADELTDETAMVVNDGSMYAATLCTLPNHCCNCWSPIIESEGV